MDKRIGSLFLVVQFFSGIMFGFKEPKIQIDFMNKQHRPIEKAEVGVPFVIQISCQNFEPKTEPQGFESKQDVTLQYAGSTQLIRQMNGSMEQEEYIFKYIAISKHKGILHFDPVSVQARNGSVIRSEKISIEVGDIAQSSYTGSEPYILDVSSSADQLYVGQKFTIDVNFCYKAIFEDLSIENPLFEDVEIGYQDKTWKSTEKIIGSNPYSCKQISIDLFPKKVGTLIIPSVRATFTPEYRQDVGLFGVFGFINSKILESTPKQIEVLPLPESKKYKNVQAVGNFTSASLHIDSKNGQVGEGIHAKIIIEGNGNLDIVPHLELMLPDGVHAYEGNSSVEYVNQNVTKKIFDWVLQSDYAGNYTVPEQQFVYFDPADKKYKTIHTNSAELVIHADESLQQPAAEEVTVSNVSLEQQEQKSETFDSDVSLDQKEKIQYYSPQKFNYNSASSTLTWWIIFLGVLVALLFLVIILTPYFKKIFFIETFEYRWLFWKYSRTGDIQAIYKLFEKIAHDYNFELQSEKLEQAFLKNKYSQDSFSNWKNFLHMLLEFNFASNKTLEDKQLVVDLAKEWFSIILLCCKALPNKQNSK